MSSANPARGELWRQLKGLNRLIADTTFLIDLMIGDEAAVEKARDIESKSVPLAVTAPSVFELYVGLSLSRKAEEEKTKIMGVLESLPFLPRARIGAEP